MGKVSPIVRYKNKLITSISSSPDLVELVNADYVGGV